MRIPTYNFNIRNRNSFEISGSLLIKSPQKKIWSILIKPGHLELFHPFCKKHNLSTDWNGVGGKDTGFFYNGKKIKREVIRWDEGKNYKIKMNNGDGNNTFVHFQTQEKTSETAYFSIQIVTDSYRKIPRPVWYLFANFFLVPSYKNYLNSVLNGLAYYSETGNKVKKNQFGKHQIFSA